MGGCFKVQLETLNFSLDSLWTAKITPAVLGKAGDIVAIPFTLKEEGKPEKNSKGGWELETAEIASPIHIILKD